MNSKLIRELQTLVKNEVISIEVADKIETYYNSKSPNQSNKLLTIFGVIGSLLVGLGIILVLAHNWDNFSKITKTVLAFLPLLVGQIIVGYSLLKKKSKTWLESSGVFLFFAVGSSISLVSQIYNIPGNLSSFLLTWILLCVPLIYLLKSKALFLLILVFATVYSIDVGYNFSGIRKVPWMYLLIIAILLPKYLMLLKDEVVQNYTSLLNWLFPLSFIIVFGAFINSNFLFELILYILLFGLLYNIGLLKKNNKTRLVKNGFLVIGSIGLVITLLLASSKSFWYKNIDVSNLEIKEILIVIILVLSTVFVLLKNNFFKNKGYQKLFQSASIIMIFIFIVHYFDVTVALSLINFTILALGVTTIKKGVDTINFTLLNYGLLIITALIITRFFDTNMSFVVRGLLFILVGVGFFSTNYLLAKKIKKNA
ncbi:DUF2157 domain-containing protein [Polaribacter sp. Asnod6-C07]|uniref:DUF2157 domain-containing protein n=1 Tax=Polaribacter sp. Asnod6-C07 TaxID=3160582 RepID=UPI00386EAEC6